MTASGTVKTIIAFSVVLVLSVLLILGYRITLSNGSSQNNLGVRSTDEEPSSSVNPNDIDIEEERVNADALYERQGASLTRISSNTSSVYYPFNSKDLLKLKKPVIYALQRRIDFPSYEPPVFEEGVVLYVYGENQCEGKKRYLEETFWMIRHLYVLNRDIKVALITNCNIPLSMFRRIDVLIPIHTMDIFSDSRVTRMIYNAYLPFAYNLILESDMYPCDAAAIPSILSLFKASRVDVSFPSRSTFVKRALRSLLLSHQSNAAFSFWTTVAARMLNLHYSDQRAMTSIALSWSENGLLDFKWTSSNWGFSPIRVNEKGQFNEEVSCYYASDSVTGRVRFAHLARRLCRVMNGPQNSTIHRVRSYVKNGKCAIPNLKSVVVYKREVLEKVVTPYPVPEVYYDDVECKPSDSLYWYDC